MSIMDNFTECNGDRKDEVGSLTEPAIYIGGEIKPLYLELLQILSEFNKVI